MGVIGFYEKGLINASLTVVFVFVMNMDVIKK